MLRPQITEPRVGATLLLSALFANLPVSVRPNGHKERGAGAAAIETATGMQAQKQMMGMQPGDVPATWVETRLIHVLTGYTPKVRVSDGVERYRAYYNI